MLNNHQIHQCYDAYNILPIGSIYAIYAKIYHQYTPVMLALIYKHHGSVMGWVVTVVDEDIHSTFFHPLDPH